MGDGLEVQALLAAEVPGDERGSDAGALADVAHRGGLVPALVEELDRGVQERAAASLGMPAACGGSLVINR